MQKFKSMTPAQRIQAGGSIVFILVQYTLYLCSAIALTIATGYYLWKEETENQCKAPNDKDDRDQNNWIDVSARYNIILKIYFAYFITECVRCVIILIAACLKSQPLAAVYQFLSPNDCLGLAALIILHIYRFQYSGKQCSVDK